MQKNHLKITLLLVVFFASTQSVHAIDPDSLKAQLVKDWQRAKAYTKTYLDIMPADKYSFTPIDTGNVRSFAGQMLHLAQGNIFLISTATGKNIIFNYPNPNNLTAPQIKDSVLYCVLASYDYCITALKEMDVSKFNELVTNANHSISRFEWIMVGFEHQIHQRALCTMYIRLIGIKPPDEMLF